MTPRDEQVVKKAEPASRPSCPAALPPGSLAVQIAFVSECGSDQEVLLEFPHPLQRRAVIVQTDADLCVLTIPALSRDAENEAESELLTKMREWVGVTTPAPQPASLLMTLQGAQICWSQGRLAILAQPERLETVRASLIEAAFYETEIRDIERALGEAWPQLERDMPLAFEIDNNSLSQRKQLRQRFRDILLLRARLARIGPHVHSPHLHPPTLASQVAERFRERTRMPHRHEFLSEQIEVFERVYEMCGQRASDFMLTRSGNTLEWIIIVLLLGQLVLIGFEYLAILGK